MSHRCTILLSDEVRAELDERSRSEGVSASEIVDRALRRHLFIRRFRNLRAETLEHMREVGFGDLTDQDVFRLDEMPDDEYRRYLLEKVRCGSERADAEGALEPGEAEARLAKWITE